jgi:methionyl-tRNA formyltransferase
MNILVVTDNVYLFEQFKKIVSGASALKDCRFDFTCTNKALFAGHDDIHPIDIKGQYASQIIGVYDLVISIHCKQLFPKEMIAQVRCINVHPGLNPFNRGWYPPVFSIINKLPVGATIHEIDEEIDHGPIICQQEVPVFPYDTSLDVYNRVLQAELELLQTHLVDIVFHRYQTTIPADEGHVNLSRHFREMCKLDLDKPMTMGESIDLLRALTHHPYKNAYFIDKETGKKIYVSVSLHPEG